MNLLKFFSQSCLVISLATFASCGRQPQKKVAPLKKKVTTSKTKQSFAKATRKKSGKKLMPIRVLLGSLSNESASYARYECMCEKGFIITIPGEKVQKLPAVKKVNIIYRSGTIYYQLPYGWEKKVKGNHITLSGMNGQTGIKDKTYSGYVSFSLNPKNNKPQVINILDLEDYIYSVIRFETYQSWPLEMHKVQAVASRTYAVHHILKARKKGKHYDLKNSNVNQTYGGMHEFYHIKDAVDQTRHLVLTHKDEVALAMFDICCGSIVPAYMKSPDFEKAPYLARKDRCYYCKDYSLYSWTYNAPIADIMKRLSDNYELKQKIKSIGTCKDISVAQKDRAGIVQTLKIQGNKKTIECSGEQFWGCFKDKVRSLSFSLKKSGNNLVVSGTGFGHQIGVCQRGAHQLVKKGWNFKKILQFYYPNINFTELTSLLSSQKRKLHA